MTARTPQPAADRSRSVAATDEILRRLTAEGLPVRDRPGADGRVTATVISNFWHDQLVAHSRQGLFLVLVGFVGSFGFIRMSTRLMRSPRVPWWPGSIVTDSGVHLHHLVFGIVPMMAAGTLGFWFFDTSPWLRSARCSSASAPG